MACPTVKLSSGYFMPIVGLGTYDDFKIDRTASAVAASIDAGYRHIDAAWVYLCEAEVGKGISEKIKDGTVKRENLFVVSKLWSTCHTRVEAALRETLTDLGLDYLDLYLIHFLMAFEEMDNSDAQALLGVNKYIGHDFIDTWKDMEQLVDQGLVRSLGLSNFNQEQITRLLNAPDLKYKPVCMQMEIQPLFTNHELVEFCNSVNIQPVGYGVISRAGVDFYGEPFACALEEPLLKNLAAKYNKTTVQITLRWAVQRDVVVLIKSCNPDRIKSNIQLFDFELTPKEVAAISLLNKNLRVSAAKQWREHAEFPFMDVRARHGLV